MPIHRGFAVVKRAKDLRIMMVFAYFNNRDAADLYCERANVWYGEDHPLTPLTVDTDVLFEPKPFPDLT